MLTDDLARVRREPGPAAVTFALAFAVGIILGVLNLFGDDSERGANPTANATTITEEGGATRTAPQQADPNHLDQGARASELERSQRRTLGGALRKGVEAAKAMEGGVVEAALWVDSWGSPVVKPLGLEFRLDQLRMWSMSKVVTAIASFEEGQPDAEGLAAIKRALVRSENCPQRRVVLGLMDLKGSADAVITTFADVLSRGDVTSPDTDVRIAGPEVYCRSYLEKSHAKDPLGAAPQLGTATWTVRDAVAFTLRLGQRSYGDAGDRVLEIMRRPKKRAEEGGGPYTPPSLSWGAGNSFRRWTPAYKAGWGSSSESPYLIGQIATMVVDGHVVAVAAMYRPTNPRPSNDDPGETVGPEALEAVFDPVAEKLAAGALR